MRRAPAGALPRANLQARERRGEEGTEFGVVSSTLPGWLTELRRREIVDRVMNDSRTSGDNLLGISTDVIFKDVIAAGRANFSESWQHLTPDDRVLLYAYLNQLGHVEELVAAFHMLFEGYSLEAPVVVDLGCGPFTAGLALYAVLEPGRELAYVGIDTSIAMRDLGDRLAVAAEATGQTCVSTRYWSHSLSELASIWPNAPGWRPILVVVSYLLASDTVDPTALVAELAEVLTRIGCGEVLLLCTNSTDPRAGRKFPAFREALERYGFEMKVDDIGNLQIARGSTVKKRSLSYALFYRQALGTLNLEGG